MKASAQRGLTLVELMLAAGLSAIVMLALVRLVDSATDLWTKGEQRRAVVEQGAAVGALVARDLRALHAGTRGDLIVDWFPHDTDQDGRFERLWPRLRLVRTAAPADLARLRARAAAEAARAARTARERDARGALSVEEVNAVDEADPTALPPVDLAGIGLMEVVWALIPRGSKGDLRYEGLLLRGERLLAPNEAPRLLAADVFGRNGRPAAELVEEITGGVLWFDVRLATQTTLLDPAAPDGGWRTGSELVHAATSWDAYGLNRPNPDLHVWNEPSPGQPRGGVLPNLPRRIRLELEVERERDLARRPLLIEDVEESAVRLPLTTTKGLEEVLGRFVLVEGEWLKVTDITGDALLVNRAQRGTGKRRLPEGARLHFGEPIVIDTPVALHRDEWDLSGEEPRR